MLYKTRDWLTQSSDPAFDKIYRPGETPEHSGIYRCTGCGREAVAEASRTLPPQNHHQHPAGKGDVRWQMAGYCDPREK